MTTTTTPPWFAPWQSSRGLARGGQLFERFCLTAGIAIVQMMCEDAPRLCGRRMAEAKAAGHRWGKTKGKIGFHGGKVAVHRPRVRATTAMRSHCRAGRRHWPRTARQLGDESDADQRVDAQARARRPAAGRRSALRGRAPPNRRHRVGSWRCRRSAWRSG